MRLPNIGELWRHYKGGVYLIHDIVYGCERDLDIRIVYVNSRGHTFSRPLNNFLDLVADRQRFVPQDLPEPFKVDQATKERLLKVCVGLASNDEGEIRDGIRAGRMINLDPALNVLILECIKLMEQSLV